MTKDDLAYYEDTLVVVVFGAVFLVIGIFLAWYRITHDTFGLGGGGEPTTPFLDLSAVFIMIGAVLILLGLIQNLRRRRKKAKRKNVFV